MTKSRRLLILAAAHGRAGAPFVRYGGRYVDLDPIRATRDGRVDVDHDRALAGRSIAMSRAERLVDNSIRYLEEIPSFSAEIDFETWLFDKKYYGHGRYEELSILRDQDDSELKAPLERTRFILQAEMTPEKDAGQDAASETLEIACDCDKRAWWRYNTSDKSSPLGRIDIEELKNSLKRLSEEENACLRENGIERSCAMSGMPGLGGVAGALKRIASFYRFEPDFQEVVAPGDEGKSDGSPNKYFKVVGDARARFWSAVRANLRNGTDEVPLYIAENLPVHVEIYFCMVDDEIRQRRPFPCKIAYYAPVDGKIDSKAYRPLFAMEYSSIVRNDPTINVGDFDYSQPARNYERLTNDYVKTITRSPGDVAP